MKTLVEFWDQDPMKNVYGTVACRPDKVLYLVAPGDVPTRHSKGLSRFFKGLGIEPKLAFQEVQRGDLTGLLQLLEQILEEESDCCFEMTGGSELAIAALGQLSAKRPVPMIRFDLDCGRIVLKENCDWAVEQKVSFECRDVIRLMGGELLDSHGHFDGRDMSEEMREDSMKVWGVYRKYYKQWSTQIFYFQKMQEDSEDPLRMKAPKVVHRDAYNTVSCNENILRGLANAGVLKELEITNKQVTFRYKNAKLKEMLAIAGLWLEIYCFLAAKEAGVFEDAQISALINWDGQKFKNEAESVHNEIDVLLVRKTTPTFISCKSGSVSASSLYEISVLARELGGSNARKVLATTMPLKKQAPHVANRAKQMGVELVEVYDLDLVELGQRLEEISRPCR